jgi:hypothetical protein
VQVFLGNYRCDSLGIDLNRAWLGTQATTAPTVHAVRELGRRYTCPEHAQPAPGAPAPAHLPFRLEQIIDLHAHSTCMSGFVFANLPATPREMEGVSAFPRALAAHSKDFSSPTKFEGTDPLKAGTGRRALSDLLPGVHCYTVEVSMFCAGQGNLRGEPCAGGRSHPPPFSTLAGVYRRGRACTQVLAAALL